MMTVAPSLNRQQQLFWSFDQVAGIRFDSSTLDSLISSNRSSSLAFASQDGQDHMEFRISENSFDAIGIIKTVTASISEVFFLCLVGYILSLQGIIDAKSKTTLNQINVSFFTPALMFSKVAFSLTSEKLADLYVVPLSFVVITAVSLVIAWLLARLFRLGRAETNFCLSFSMFMNSNSLPIALMTSLISTIHGRSGLSWGSDDSKDKQLGRSLSYLVVFSTLGLIFRWSYGVKLLSASVGSESDDASVSEVTRAHPAEETVGLLNSSEADSSILNSTRQTQPRSSVSIHRDGPLTESTLSISQSPATKFSTLTALTTPVPKDPYVLTPPSAGSSSSAILFLDPTASVDLQRPRQLSPKQRHPQLPPDWRPQSGYPTIPPEHTLDDKRPLQRPIFHSFPNVRAYWTQSIASSRTSVGTLYEGEDGSVESPGEVDESAGNARPHVERRSRRKQVERWTHHAWKLWKRIIIRPLLKINQFMTPPLYASVLSLVVVALPRLQSWLAGIQPVRSALKSAGNVSVPLTLVVLGAYFNTNSAAKKPVGGDELLVSSEIEEAGEDNKRLVHKRRKEQLTILASLLSRQILTPLILVPLLFGILRYFHTSGDLLDPVGRTGNFHEDPCFILVTVLLIGAPPAITLAQMTSANPFPVGSRAHSLQAAQNAGFERLVSKTLLISYAILTPPTTIALVVAGLLVEANR